MDAILLEERETPEDRKRLAVMGRVVPFAFATTVILLLVGFVLSLRVCFPGNWLGNNGWIIGSLKVALMAMTSFSLTCYMLLRLKRYLSVFVLIACLVGFLFLSTLSHSLVPRFRVEQDAYQQAILSGKPYGDQFSHQADGRKLTYWRWVAWGLDNAYGVIYDPEDRFSKDGEDGSAFRGETGGFPFKVQKMEPHWYIVEHS